MTTGTVSHAQTLKGWFILMKDSKNSHPGNKLWGNGWGWSWFDAGNPSKTTSTDYKQDCLPCHEPARATDWGIDRFQLLQQERDLLRFAGEHGIPVPEVIAYFDPHDGPVVLVLEQIKVDGTLPSDDEIGETVRRLHGLEPPALCTVAQGSQIPSSTVAELTVRRLSVIERLTEGLCWKPTVEELDRLLAPINMDGRLLHMDLRPANYLCQRNRLMGLIDWSNALIAAPILELARIAEYGGLSPAFANGYKLTSDMTAALDQEMGIACRLYTAVMLCILFLAQLRLLDKAERQISRLKELLGLLGLLEGMLAI
jgi:hypothetical protein